MKLPSELLFNSIGFENVPQQILYLASVLRSATATATAITITSAVPAVVAKAEIVAQTAKPVRAATSAVLAANNTVGYAFGELYLNSPAYPIGTAIPAIAAKPASAAVVAVPAVVAAPAIPAVVVPAVAAVKGWGDAVAIASSATDSDLVIDLPYTLSTGLIGATPAIKEITPTTLQPTAWLDTKASNTPSTVVLPMSSLESFLHEKIKTWITSGGDGSIAKAVRMIDGIATPVKRITLSLLVSNYNPLSDSLQLDKVITSR